MRGCSLRTAVLVGEMPWRRSLLSWHKTLTSSRPTPGRLLHHLAEVQGFSLGSVEYCVFDEADRMFEMGFAEQVSHLLVVG